MLSPLDMTVVEFMQRLARADAECEHLAAQILSDGADELKIYPYVRAYLCIKFMLDDGDAQSDDIAELAAISIEQITGLKKNGLEFIDHSGTCAAVSSAITKKILLLISLQKALSITFPRNETADILTITQLCSAISRQIIKEAIP